MSRTIRVSVLDERRLFREALAARLRSEQGIELSAATDRLRDVLAVARKHPLDVVLVDINSGRNRVLAIIWDIKSHLPDVRVVALGAAIDSETLLRCVEAGACGYTGPETSYEELLRRIREVAVGRTTCSPAVLCQVMSRIRELSCQRHQQQPPANGGLSEREIEIVKLIALGLINKEISRRLEIRLSTVKNHVHNILQKLQVQRRKDTVQRAYELGILNH